jgi:Ca-activated chloride channel homolog
MNVLTTFHFLRPTWWWALLPMALLWWWQRAQLQTGWRAVVDARLLPHLLVGADRQQRHRSVLLAIGGLLTIAALAGPAWRKIEQPVYSRESSLVVILDLSRSMDAADVKPTRLQRVRLKLRDVLRARTEGETALIVFAAQPFVVSPLTRDAHTIEAQLESLTTDLMPQQGSRIDLALELAQKLLQQAGATSGGVLLLTDGMNDESTNVDSALAAAQSLSAAHFSLSILGAGTEQGAPISLPLGGFLKDTQGNIVLPKLYEASLKRIAHQGGGEYRRLSIDDSDWQDLMAPINGLSLDQNASKVETMMSDEWRDEGPWLLLPVLLLAALAFRRGVVFMWLLACFFSVQSLQPVHAADANDKSWQRWWWNDDQRGQRAMQAQKPQQAAQLFQDPAWRASAQYRAGDYQTALQGLSNLKGVDADYNRGNTLAQLGRYQDALKSYDYVLKADPNHADAKFNRDLVSKLLKESQKKQGGQQSSQDKSPQQQSSQQQSSQDQQGKQDHSQSSESQSQSSAGQQPNEAQQQAQKNDQQKDQQAGLKEQKSQSSQAARQQKKDKNQSKSSGDQEKTQREASSKDKEDGVSQSNSNQASPEKQANAVGEQTTDKQLDRYSEQLLRRVPDDPGGLWRRKFESQYKKQRQAGKQSDGGEPW